MDDTGEGRGIQALSFALFAPRRTGAGRGRRGATARAMIITKSSLDLLVITVPGRRGDATFGRRAGTLLCLGNPPRLLSRGLGVAQNHRDQLPDRGNTHGPVRTATICLRTAMSPANAAQNSVVWPSHAWLAWPDQGDAWPAHLRTG